MFMFTRQGVVLVDGEDVDEDKIMEDALEAGADDVIPDEGVFDIRTGINAVADVSEALTKLGYTVVSAQPEYVPSTYTALQGEVKGQLSALGCSFVADPSQADYVITVQAKAREYNRADFGGNVAYFAYVDADISLTKTATGQRIYDDFLSIKGGHTHNYSQAARTAYKDLAKEIDKLIKQYIQ
jgi:hypothetical protein